MTSLEAYNEASKIITAFRSSETKFEDRPSWADYKAAMAAKIKIQRQWYLDLMYEDGRH